MRCEIHYNPNYQQGAKATAYRYTVGWLAGNQLGNNDKANRTARSDDVDIKIFENDEATEPVSEGHGSWLSHLIIDEKILWRIEDESNNITWKEYGDYSNGMFALPSDTCQRIDVAPIQNNEWEEAEANKLKLEQLQRNDKKLRKEAEKRREQKK
jgi:hypothetical protein